MIVTFQLGPLERVRVSCQGTLPRFPVIFTIDCMHTPKPWDHMQNLMGFSGACVCNTKLPRKVPVTGRRVAEVRDWHMSTGTVKSAQANASATSATGAGRKDHLYSQPQSASNVALLVVGMCR